MHIGIVENDPDFRDDLLLSLKMNLPGVKLSWWQSSENFLKVLPREKPDVLLIDIVLPGINGIELCRNLQSLNFDGKLIVLTNMNSDEMILDAIQNGAMGYLLKSESGEIVNLINTVMNGGAILTPTIALRVMMALKTKKVEQPQADLSPRLQQVLDLMVSGKTVSQVAKELKIQPNTVHGYVKDIYKKLNVHNRAQLVGRVYRNRQKL